MQSAQLEILGIPQSYELEELPSLLSLAFGSSCQACSNQVQVQREYDQGCGVAQMPRTPKQRGQRSYGRVLRQTSWWRIAEAWTNNLARTQSFLAPGFCSTLFFKFHGRPTRLPLDARAV